MAVIVVTTLQNLTNLNSPNQLSIPNIPIPAGVTLSLSLHQLLTKILFEIKSAAR